MKYFLLLEDDTEKDVYFEVFWGAYGLKVLMKIVDQKPELLPTITIKTDKGKSMDVSEFLMAIDKLKVRIS